VLRNLAYILQTGSHDLGGLCVWLVKLLADHPDWAAIVRDEAATLPGVHGLSDGYDLRTVADGPLTFGPFHWRPSPAFRVELTRVPPAARACKGSENRTTAPLARA